MIAVCCAVCCCWVCSVLAQHASELLKPQLATAVSSLVAAVSSTSLMGSTGLSLFDTPTCLCMPIRTLILVLRVSLPPQSNDDMASEEEFLACTDNAMSSLVKILTVFEGQGLVDEGSIVQEVLGHMPLEDDSDEAPIVRAKHDEACRMHTSRNLPNYILCCCICGLSSFLFCCLVLISGASMVLRALGDWIRRLHWRGTGVWWTHSLSQPCLPDRWRPSVIYRGVRGRVGE